MVLYYYLIFVQNLKKVTKSKLAWASIKLIMKYRDNAFSKLNRSRHKEHWVYHKTQTRLQLASIIEWIELLNSYPAALSF